MTKFIFITGGVVSGLGKGILAASTGALIKAREKKVTMLKFDPYFNLDAGTMSPYQHGEVFVLKDGTETDLDLGHYERFLDQDLTGLSNVTSGKIYSSVISKERKGEYLGATVQMIPHVTNEIKRALFNLAEQSNADVLVAEVGGTVGDIEGLPFLEAIRQVRLDLNGKDVFYVHTTLVPFLETSGEQKTKPTQHSVRELRSIGIQPDVIVCRSRTPMTKQMREKVALFCDVGIEGVISLPDLDSIYQVPLFLEEAGYGEILSRFLGFQGEPNLEKWQDLSQILREEKPPVKIGIVGKYVGMKDTYLSVIEALRHSCLKNRVDLKVQWIPSEKLEGEGNLNLLLSLDGIIVPGGFDRRGVEGKINAIKFARENGIPFLGLCLGMQCAVIEFARNVCGLKKANSTEFDPETPFPVIDLLKGQEKVKRKGGTMRLGAYPCKVKKGSMASEAYGSDLVWERHRHRYEVNGDFLSLLEEKGLTVSGIYPKQGLAEIVEIPGHPFFLGSQFHPEFTSRPGRPNPLFDSFVKAAKRRANQSWKS
ncbi:MAG: CTP synthase [Caldiserica bacterium]|jgi:CTP synthase|nr:CTP synthase [Caldisericota bacterium]MDH7562762.1 CTP synthase [Caldisericota bacterium]